MTLRGRRAGFQAHSAGFPKGRKDPLFGLSTGIWATGGLLLFILHGNGLKVFGLEDLAAIETFQVLYAVSSGDNLGTGMVTSRLHNQRLDETYFIQVHALVKPHLGLL
jgi:hypothetical protein